MRNILTSTLYVTTFTPRFTTSILYRDSKYTNNYKVKVKEMLVTVRLTIYSCYS